jgi:tetratricopeptide (TPR) repeat protein
MGPLLSGSRARSRVTLRGVTLIFILPLLLVLGGCANRGITRYQAISKQTSAQDYLAAVKILKKERSALYGTQSTLLYYMDVGLLYHYANAYDSSIVYLTRAVNLQDDLYARSISNEAASLLVNDNVRPYRGRSYEIVWLHLFLAFDYLALDRVDDARIEMRQTEIFLNEVRRKAGGDATAYRDDPTFRAFSALVYEALGERDDAAISIYAAVKSLRQRKRAVPSGMANYAWRLLDAEDRDDDIRDLDLKAPAIKPERLTGAGNLVVVGQIGRSPSLGETSFWGTWVRDGVMVYNYRDENGKTISQALPAPGLPASAFQGGGRTRSGMTLHIKWAMPSLRDAPVASRAMQVSAEGIGTVSGESWGDTRELLAQDLDEGRTALLTRTIIRVAVRTLAAEKAKAEMQTSNPIVNLLLSLGADALADQLEQADVRMWFLLPRSLTVAQVQAPAGTLALQWGALDADGRAVRTETRETEVKPGKTRFVFFNSLK